MERPANRTNPSLRVDLRGRVFGREPAVVEAPPPAPGLLQTLTSRRKFLKIGGAAGFTLAAALLLDDLIRAGTVSAQSTVVLADAKGVIIADNHICVGCRRCELACTEFNRGKAQPYIANVKIYRNFNYGTSLDSGEGQYGNFMIRQETCKQCKQPVPCASACPVGAIQADTASGTNARKVDTAACIGCGACVEACPYDMPTVDPSIGKSQKCFLCNGSPKCVAGCPTGALLYVAWEAPSVPADTTVPSETTSSSKSDDRGGGCFIQTLKRD